MEIVSDHEWVGWRNDSVGLEGSPLEILFEFDRVRNFSAMSLHVSNQFSKDVMVSGNCNSVHLSYIIITSYSLSVISTNLFLGVTATIIVPFYGIYVPSNKFDLLFKFSYEIVPVPLIKCLPLQFKTAIETIPLPCHLIPVLLYNILPYNKQIFFH